ncbi:MAG: FGGY family carbohydrate kinase [Gemmatimonadota bacterium]
MLVAGIDSSTQSTKVLLCRAEDGAVTGRGSAPHPGGTECDPAAWWAALQQAGGGLLEQAAAVGVAGQQHGMVALDDRGEVVRPALLWNDLRSADAAAALVAERGPQWWARETGSVPNASFTVTKLRWLAASEPQHAARAAAVLLPHDWVSWRLRGGRGEPVTDRGEASGTGYFSPASGQWLPELVTAALGHPARLPRVAQPAEVTGETGWGAAVSAGTGDNMAAALGLGLQPGEVAVSVGTSGTAFAVAAVPAADATGAVAGFADATGRFLPLVCTVNAGLVLDAVARLIGTDGAGLAERALAAGPGAGGLTLLPYFDGERTPDRPLATGALRGASTRNLTPENLARAAVEGVLASLASVAGLLGACGVDCQRVLLIGGATRSEAIRVIAPSVFGVPVEVPEPGEYVALGAARQAAWALAGTPAPPDWPRPPAKQYTGPPQPGLLQRFAELRDATVPWDSTVPWDKP